MNLKKLIRKKRGSYFVEAGLTLPVFILSVVALILVINIIAICENIGFVTSLELKDISLKAYAYRVPVLVEKSVENSVFDENPKLNTFEVTNLDYLYYDRNAGPDGIEDLIGIEEDANFRVENPVGIYGEINFNLKLLSRAFTGKDSQGTPLNEEGFHSGDNRTCYIFPKYGIRYHREDCYYVAERYKDVDNHIMISVEEAVRRGYTPCKVCGGAE